MLRFFKVHNGFSLFRRVFDLGARALTDIASDIDDIDGIGHVYLALVHVVQHLLGPGSPNLFITGMAEEADTDDDVAFEGETLLGLKEIVLEARAAAEGYDFELADHDLLGWLRNAFRFL